MADELAWMGRYGVYIIGRGWVGHNGSLGPVSGFGCEDGRAQVP